MWTYGNYVYINTGRPNTYRPYEEGTGVPERNNELGQLPIYPVKGSGEANDHDPDSEYHEAEYDPEFYEEGFDPLSDVDGRPNDPVDYYDVSTSLWNDYDLVNDLAKDYVGEEQCVGAKSYDV